MTPTAKMRATDPSPRCDRALVRATSPAVAGARYPVRAYGEHGAVGALLEDFVQKHGIGLATMGTSGRRGLAVMLPGSVAQRLLADLGVDVLAVRGRRN